jgi:NADH:ubiquinone oxidoreductase subunit H
MDLVEGESELVSGFNAEYYGVEFAPIFIAEIELLFLFNYLIFIY